MKTYEGSLTLKWSKNGAADKRPLTIDTDSKDTLKVELDRIRVAFLTKGENDKLPYSISFELSERI